MENVLENGELSDCFEGRHMNPGHSLEAMWFIMDLGKRLDRPELIMKAKDTALKMVNYGWDKEYGGLFYFMDMISSAGARMGPKTVVGPYRNAHRYVEGISNDRR